MKTKIFALAALAAFAFACTPYDDSALVGRIDDLEGQVEKNTQSIQDLKNKLEQASQQGITIKSVTPTTGGFVIVFSDNSTYTIKNGEKGEQGPAGQDGKDGKDGTGADIQITENADSYTITIGQKSYTIAKMVVFAIKLEKTAVKIKESETVNVAYTITGAAEGDDVHVYVSQEVGYTAAIDEANKKVAITAPAVLPETGYVIVSAINNTTSQQAAQYVSFINGVLTVVSDATEPVAAEGGTVTLTITTTDPAYTVVVPETCNWITVSDTKAAETYTKYLIVAANTGAAREATITVKSNAGDQTVVVSQLEYVAPIHYEIPDGAIHVLQAGETAKDATEIAFEDLVNKLDTVNDQTAYDYLNGKTFYFDAATYELPQKASPEFCSMSSPCVVRFFGQGTTLVACPLSSNTKKQRQHFSVKCNCDFTFENINFTDANGEGNTNGAAFWVGCGDKERPATAKLTVKNCTFKNCSASNGPCLFGKNNCDIIAIGCKFTDCNGQGGAIGGDTSIKEANLTVTDCEFKNCTTSSFGGAIDVRKYTTFTCTGTKFVNCKASRMGSAICIGSSSALTTAPVIDNCVFDGCTGADVVAIYKCSAPAKISNCVFKNNTVAASKTSGDISNTYPAVLGSKYPVWMNNCKFYGNTVPETGSVVYARQACYANEIVICENGTVKNAILKGEDGQDTDVLVLANSTVIAPATAAAIDAAGEAGCFYNNIIVNTTAGQNAIKTTEYMGGYNILGLAAGVTTEASDMTIAALTDLTNGAWDATTAQYIWDGPAVGFTQITPSTYAGCVSDAGQEYVAWLGDVNANASRGNAATWWPGAYQK